MGFTTGIEFLWGGRSRLGRDGTDNKGLKVPLSRIHNAGGAAIAAQGCSNRARTSGGGLWCSTVIFSPGPAGEWSVLAAEPSVDDFDEGHRREDFDDDGQGVQKNKEGKGEDDEGTGNSNDDSQHGVDFLSDFVVGSSRFRQPPQRAKRRALSE